jgi:hypothetical protein
MCAGNVCSCCPCTASAPCVQPRDESPPSPVTFGFNSRPEVQGHRHTARPPRKFTPNSMAQYGAPQGQYPAQHPQYAQYAPQPGYAPQAPQQGYAPQPGYAPQAPQPGYGYPPQPVWAPPQPGYPPQQAPGYAAQPPQAYQAIQVVSAVRERDGNWPRKGLRSRVRVGAVWVSVPQSHPHARCACADRQARGVELRMPRECARGCPAPEQHDQGGGRRIDWWLRRGGWGWGGKDVDKTDARTVRPTRTCSDCLAPRFAVWRSGLRCGDGAGVQPLAALAVLPMHGLRGGPPAGLAPS